MCHKLRRAQQSPHALARLPDPAHPLTTLPVFPKFSRLCSRWDNTRTAFTHARPAAETCVYNNTGEAYHHHNYYNNNSSATAFTAGPGAHR